MEVELDSAHNRIQFFQAISQQFKYLVYFESNHYEDPYGRFEWLILGGNTNGIEFRTPNDHHWKRLSEWINHTSGKYRAGVFGYECGLDSTGSDLTGFPLMGFFEATFIRGKSRKGEFISIGNTPTAVQWALEDKVIPQKNAFRLVPGISQLEYLKRFEEIKKNLYLGNIYEVNFCQVFESKTFDLNPFLTWKRLNQISPAPFACLFKFGESWLIGSSPERFMCKRGQTITSQPIKGTCKRTGSLPMDQELANQLQNSSKERSENIMIVDLVRNDLSSTLKPGSVKVDELCGIYQFARVQHMISSISGTLKDGDNGIQTIEKAFPMGSMTGAPKLKAMEIAGAAETFNRGIYSGSVGYFDPEGDFDLNVVIRSISWSEHSGHLRFAAGSAVTAQADANAEFAECLLKAESMLESLEINDYD
jgi:para-aminobenzoate synthetase component I